MASETKQTARSVKEFVAKCATPVRQTHCLAINHRLMSVISLDRRNRETLRVSTLQKKEKEKRKKEFRLRNHHVAFTAPGELARLTDYFPVCACSFFSPSAGSGVLGLEVSNL